MAFSLSCPAKLNLFLEIVGKRPDGYHNIESVFLAIDLADTLHARPQTNNSITLTCDQPDVPSDEGNLAVKAAKLLQQECGTREGIAFHLEKRIPMGGGLGGGSSNAAAALRLANTVWRCGLSDSDLATLAERIGSDVPFFLHGGLCLCQGRGERITPLKHFPNHLRIGLALPPLHSDTASAYRGLHLPTPGTAKKADDFIKAVETGDPAAISAAAFNRFEETIFIAFPELGRLHADLDRRLGHGARMTGSGSGLWFFIGPNENTDQLQEWAVKEKTRVLSTQPQSDDGTFSLTSVSGSG